jgi:transcriptional regulator with XRE-family HTH domain
MTTIGQRITALKKYKGMNQTELANFLGVSPSTISTLERDESQPSYDVTSAVRKRIPEINIYWFLYGEGGMILSNGENVTNEDIEAVEFWKGMAILREKEVEMKTKELERVKSLLKINQTSDKAGLSV